MSISEAQATLKLSGDEYVHSIKSARFRVGDRIGLTDGRGTLAITSIVEVGKKAAMVQIESSQHPYKPLPYHLELAFVPPKHTQRLEWLIEKAVEVGVTELKPVISFHSERRDLREGRLVRLMVAAMKQSQKAFLPAIHPIMPIEQYLSSCSSEMRVLCHSKGDQLLHNHVKKSKDIAILVGPEGDFSESELSLADDLGWQIAHLGSQRLRAETAVVHACIQVQVAHELNQMTS